ncbi:MAG: PEP-CTERM sorting domain-containing protein [Phycisphaerae bacterium]
MRKIALSLVAAGLLASVAPVAQAALITFDSYTTGTLNAANTGNAWLVNQGGVSTKFDIAASGGLSNTKSITTIDQSIQADGTAVYQTAFNPTSGPITVSAYVKLSNLANDNTTIPIGLGISGTNTAYYNAVAGVDYVLARISRVNNGYANLTYTMQLQTENNGSATTYNWITSSSSFATTGTAAQWTATDGNWYFVAATFTKSGNNLLTNLKIVNSDNAGVLGTTVFDQTGTLANSVVANDTTVYGGFRAYANGGMAAIDNVTVVPEPTSLSLLGLGAAGLLLRRRKSV